MTLNIEGNFLRPGGKNRKEWYAKGLKYVACGSSRGAGGVVDEKEYGQQRDENWIIYLLKAIAGIEHKYTAYEKLIKREIVDCGEVRTIGGKIVAGF